MFRFEHPDWFSFFWLLPLMLLVLVLYYSWERTAIQQMGVEKTIRRFLPKVSNRRRLISAALFLSAGVLLILAAANPRRGSIQEETSQKSADVFILFDVSQSMRCQDLPPSRLENARAFALKLIRKLEGERVGLIFFAGNAFLQMPLSTDYEAAALFLQNADHTMVSEQGTALEPAIQLAKNSFDPEPGGGRALVLITDGENHDESAIGAVRDAFDDGIVLFAIGAGTTQGGPIPIGGGQYKRESDAKIIRTKMDYPLLQKMARAGRGASFKLKNRDKAIEAIDREVDRLEKRKIAIRSYREFDSYFQYFLLPALIFLFLYEFLPLKKSKQ